MVTGASITILTIRYLRPQRSAFGLRHRKVIHSDLKVALKLIKATWGYSRPTCGFGDNWGVAQETKAPKVEADRSRPAGVQKYVDGVTGGSRRLVRSRMGKSNQPRWPSGGSPVWSCNADDRTGSPTRAYNETHAVRTPFLGRQL